MVRHTNRWVTWGAICVALIVIGGLLLPLPYILRAPGPVFNVLGEVDGEPILQVEGVKSYPTTGELDLTTVSETGASSGSVFMMSALIGLFSPNSTVVPTSLQYPDGVPGEEDQEISRQVFDESQSLATAAAANYLGRPVKSDPRVFVVLDDSPADGKLEAGDIIVKVAGQRVTQAAEVGEIIGPKPAGTKVKFVVVRDEEKKKVVVTTQAPPEAPADDGQAPPADEGEEEQERTSVVGILVDNYYTSDFTVDFALSDIGGPSAGMIFSLGIVARLTEGDLLAGRHVAGTGTITADGEVGPIGGIDKKIVAAADAGANLFLAPLANCDEVSATAPVGMDITPVDSLEQAVDAVRDWVDGKPLSSCSDPSVTR